MTTAAQFFETQLITDANSAINKNKRSFNHYDVIKFAELYGKKMYKQGVWDALESVSKHDNTLVK